MAQSTAYVQACDVIQACDSYRKARKARQEGRIDSWVEKEMSKRFFAAKTREEALKRLSESIKCIHWEGGYWADKVEALRTLALVCHGGVVMLTTDDAALLQSYWQFPIVDLSRKKG